MLPVLSTGHLADQGHRDTVPLGEDLQWGPGLFGPLCSNLQNLFRSQLRQMLFLAASFVTTTFLYHVVYVGLVIAQEEVVGSAAFPIVASVEDESVLGDGAVRQLPSHAVRHQHRVSLLPLTSRGTHKSVPVRPAPAGPFPTRGIEKEGAVTVDPLPKPIRVWSPEFSLGATHEQGGSK